MMYCFFKLCHIYIALFLITYSQGTPICHKPNQVYATCGCPFTCVDDTDMMDMSGYRMHTERAYRIRNCTGVCETGCQCDSRHYDDGNGNCVLAKDCPLPPCPGPNEMYVLYKHCGYPTCQHMFGGIPRHFCRHLEDPGCVCKTGYVRSDNGTCLPPKDCPEYPPKCGDERKEFKECISPCQLPTCNYTGGPSASDKEQCVGRCISACVCKDEFVMNVGRGCILPDECPKEIRHTICDRPNQIHLFCGPTCMKSCDNLDPPPICRLGCYRGCYCKAGYVDSRRGCVPEDQCHSVLLWWLSGAKSA